MTIKKSSTEVCWDKNLYPPLQLTIPPSKYSSTPVTLKLSLSSPQLFAWDPQHFLWISTILPIMRISTCWFGNLKTSLTLHIENCVIGLGCCVWVQVTMCGLMCRVMTSQNYFIYTVFQHYDYYILLIFLVKFYIILPSALILPFLHIISTVLNYGDKQTLIRTESLLSENRIRPQHRTWQHSNICI